MNMPERARVTLRTSDRNGYTMPTARHFQFQRNSDMALVSIGWGTFDEARASRHSRTTRAIPNPCHTMHDRRIALPRSLQVTERSPDQPKTARSAPMRSTRLPACSEPSPNCR